MRNKFSTNLLKKSADKIAVFLVILLCAGAGFLGFFQKFDYWLYDFMLSLKKEPKSRQEILFVEIVHNFTRFYFDYTCLFSIIYKVMM